MSIKWRRIAESVEVGIVIPGRVGLVKAGGWHANQLINAARQLDFVVLLPAPRRLLRLHELVQVFANATLAHQY